MSKTKLLEVEKLDELKEFFVALFFAGTAHHLQRRKSSTDPYFVHPVRVGYLAMDAGLSVNASAAAMLHDVLEDVEMDDEQLEDFESLFAPEVLEIVKLLTKDWDDDIGVEEKKVKMGEYYRRILTNQDAVNIKLLDRIEN